MATKTENFAGTGCGRRLQLRGPMWTGRTRDERWEEEKEKSEMYRNEQKKP